PRPPAAAAPRDPAAVRAHRSPSRIAYTRVHQRAGTGTRAGPDSASMNFAFSEEQEELRRIVRQFLEAKSSEAEVRRLMETTEGYDPAVWDQMANELGLQSLIIPEEHGGQGFGYVELTVVLEEMGRSLLCAPYFSTVVLAGNTLMHSGDD